MNSENEPIRGCPPEPWLDPDPVGSDLQRPEGATSSVDRRGDEAALAREAASHPSIMNLLRDGIHLLDASGRLVASNPAFLESLGYTQAEGARLSVEDWADPSDVRALDKAMRGAGQGPRILEARFRRKDGSRFEVEISCGSVVWNGRTCCLASSRDITARKAVERERASRGAHLEAVEAALLKTLCVLLVEDEAGAREEVGDFLSRRVGTLTVAADGAEGLAAFQARPAQIVVTDIRMPRMDGLVMAREIRRLDPGVLIIATTAFGDGDYLARAIATGIDQYVLKPIQGVNLDFALLTCASRLRSPVQARVGGPSLDFEEQRRLHLLTAREREVLACLGRGQACREIGGELGISPRTVHVHQANLMVKLGLHKATALAAFAVRAGIR